MNILVCIKQVPDTAEVRIDPETNNLIRAGVPSIINPGDRTAVEKALELKNGGKVTVVSMGPPQAEEALTECLELGCDRAVLLSDRRFVGADTLATGYTLSEYIKNQEYDLILCGSEAIDGSTGQVGPIIGENLDIPVVTYVDDIKIENDSVKISRNTGSKICNYETKLPAVVCVLAKQKKNIEKSESSHKVEIINADGFDEDKIGKNGSPTKVVTIKVGKGKEDFLWVDYKWDLEHRMEYIFNGGLDLHPPKLFRADTDTIVESLFEEISHKGGSDEND
jgi:electron transfer flavoprotein beta subunit